MQMFRYLPRLLGVCSHLIVELPPRLLALAPHFKSMPQVITWGEQATAVAPVWNAQIEVMELPYIFRTALADLPLATEYLTLPSSLVEKASCLMGSRQRPRVGLVWAAGEWNPARSIPIRCLAPLWQCTDVEFWSLQGGHAQTQAAPYLAQGQMRDGTLCGDGILPLAATIANLDLVITVDTLAAHLAGALGRPTWLLLAEPADWRWMNSRSDSPWYPSFTLVRQAAGCDWTSVIARLAQRLRTLA